MKSYTDIEQSKKLADILPLESADMALCSKKQPLMTDYISAKKKFSNAGEIPIDPCWSLAALLSVVSEVSLNSFKDRNWNAMVSRNNKMIYADTDNPVDACYEMILKLYELKLL